MSGPIITDTMSYYGGFWYRLGNRAYVTTEDAVPHGLTWIIGSKRLEKGCWQNVFGHYSDGWSYQIEGWVEGVTLP